jgi:hypothetical protein
MMLDISSVTRWLSEVHVISLVSFQNVGTLHYVFETVEER